MVFVGLHRSKRADEIKLIFWKALHDVQSLPLWCILLFSLDLLRKFPGPNFLSFLDSSTCLILSLIWSTFSGSWITLLNVSYNVPLTTSNLKVFPTAFVDSCSIWGIKVDISLSSGSTLCSNSGFPLPSSVSIVPKSSGSSTVSCQNGRELKTVKPRA